ncbi:MAG: thiol-activated cytolysin family protein [Trueperaceae bacterium]
MPRPSRSIYSKAPWRPAFALVALLALVACGGQGGPVGSVDAFVAALPGWDEVAPPVVENAGEPTGETPVIDQETVDDVVYTCSTTPYSIAKNPTEMALFNPDASVLWPGALIRGGSHLSVGSLELLALSRERRAPLGISIQGGGVLGIPGGVSTIVDQPVGSTMREGINQLVVNALGADVAVGAGASTFTSVESHSTSQTLVSLGLDARYLGAEASARLDYSKDASERTYTAYFVQRLFTIAVDLPERPSSIFADGVTGADLQALGISASNLPLYIDSVSYGRILMYSFTSSDSRERIEAALEFSYDSPTGGVDGFAEADLQETLSSARIEVFALGGPNTGVQNLIRDGTLDSYFEAPLAINQVEPISFTIRNLGDNTLAKVGDTTSYEVRNCVGGLPQPQHWWPADGDTDDAIGGVDLGSLWGAYSAGWDGSDPSQRSWTFDDGQGEYLDSFPELLVVPTDGPFTLSAWINPRSTGSLHTIVSQVGGQLRAGDFAMRVYDGEAMGRLQIWRRPSASSISVDVVQSGLIVPRNTWSHVVAVYGSTGGGALEVYVNGNRVGGGVYTSTYTPSRPRPGTDLTMMRVASSELAVDPSGTAVRRYAYDGSIDELMVFDRALTEDEVSAMYQNFELYQP